MPSIMRQVSALARPLDLKYPSNLFILVVIFIILFGASFIKFYQEVALANSILWGIKLSIAIFLSWAIAREIDPDRILSALIATLLCLGVILFISENINFISLIWALFILRTINATTGLASTLWDSLLISSLGLYMTWQGDWGYGIITSIALFLDGYLVVIYRRQIILAAIIFMMTLIYILLTDDMVNTIDFSAEVIFFVLFLFLIFLPFIIFNRYYTSLTDETDEALVPARMQSAQLIALIIAIQIAFWQGEEGIYAIFPLWIAIFAVSFYWLVLLVLNKVR